MRADPPIHADAGPDGGVAPPPSIAHVKKRTAFGAPIASNQYVAGKIVDQKIGIETSRKHLYDAARRFAYHDHATDR